MQNSSHGRSIAASVLTYRSQLYLPRWFSTATVRRMSADAPVQRDAWSSSPKRVDAAAVLRARLDLVADFRYGRGRSAVAVGGARDGDGACDLRRRPSVRFPAVGVRRGGARRGQPAPR